MSFWLVLLAGLASFAWGTRARRRADAARGGPIVTARVIESRVEAADASEGLYRARVRYRYQVGDAYHYSDRVDATQLPADAPGGVSRESAESTVRRWPVGTTLDVRYDPARPDDALPARGAVDVLEDQGRIAQRVGLAVSGLAILLRVLL